MYRSDTTTIEGFVQHLAVTYISQGYYFYVTGHVPQHKDAESVSKKLVERYELGISKWARARRKRAGIASVQHLRHGRFFVLIATVGRHRFFSEEPHFKDIREKPIKFGGYSIGCKRGLDGKWHPAVSIHTDEYRKLKAYLLELALHRSAEKLAAEFSRVPFEPYAPVRRQLLNLLRAVNRERQTASFEPLPLSVLRFKRRIVRPFKEGGCVAGKGDGSYSQRHATDLGTEKDPVHTVAWRRRD